MTAEEVANALGLERLSSVDGRGRPVEGACASDLLSWVLANARPNSAWITVQTHLVVLKIALERRLACVIVADGTRVPEAVVRRAELEGLPLYRSDLAEYELCWRLHDQGV